MNKSASANRCPACGAEIPADAPHGLCPKCLLAGVNQPADTAILPPKPDSPPTSAEVAAAFPQLEILELVGQGGMGCVFKARQPKLDRLVALKLLSAKLAADAAFRERFIREARVLARLNHPEIVTVYDFGEAGGFFYLLMEYVDGANLRQAMQAGRFTPSQALAIVPKICEALQFAHSEGILHRDIKPENILLDTKGRVKIADFGIAKLIGETRPQSKLTATGAAVGTPNYMAPEQLEHPEDVDQRADIYSLGVVFYEMLTGELPMGRFAPPSKKTPLDERVDEIVLRALAKERELRQQSASEVKTQVEQLRTPPPLAPPDAGQPAQRPVSPATSTGPIVSASPSVPSLRWSKKTIAAAVLAGVGLFPPVLLAVQSFFWLSPRDHAYAMINPRFQFGFGLVTTLAPAIAGTLLGVIALSDFRRAKGQLRGGRLACVTALFWPLLLVDAVFMGFVSLAAGRLSVSLGGPPVLALLVLPLSGSVALALGVFICTRVWRWAQSGFSDGGQNRRPAAPAALALCLALVLSLAVIGFSLTVWLPILTRPSANAGGPVPGQMR